MANAKHRVLHAQVVHVSCGDFSTLCRTKDDKSFVWGEVSWFLRRWAQCFVWGSKYTCLSDIHANSKELTSVLSARVADRAYLCAQGLVARGPGSWVSDKQGKKPPKPVPTPPTCVPFASGYWLVNFLIELVYFVG